MLLLLLLGCDGAAPVAEPCPDEAGIVCRIAGTGDLGFNGDALPATESWLYFPSAVRRLPDGRLAVVDFNNMRVRAVQPDGTLATIVGSGTHAFSTAGVGALETALENPVDAVWAADGTAWVLPLHEARVLRVDPDGTVSHVAGTGSPGYDGDGGDALLAAMSEAAGLALAEDGALYVADTGNNVIRVVRDGRIATLAGAAEAGLADGDAATARFSGPQRLALDGDVLYVADANNHALRAVDVRTGAVVTVAGTGTEGWSGDGDDARAARLAFPYGVTVGDGGDLWIADSGNNVVRRVRDGRIETVAGTGEEGLSEDDGPVGSARFDFPAHLLVEGEDVYVADFGNGAVRLVRAAR